MADAILHATTRVKTFLKIALYLTVPLLASQLAHAACDNPAGGYGGFGSSVTGGAGQQIFTVDTLNGGDVSTGPNSGSIVNALTKGGRCVVFNVAGEIALKSDLRVRGAFITVDGVTAPSPGITLKNFGLNIYGNSGAHDVVIRGIRIRNAAQTACTNRPPCYGSSTGVGILVSFGAYNVVIDHVSIAHSGDAAFTVGKGSHDVTISNSVLLENKNLVLPDYNHIGLISGLVEKGLLTRRVSVHHNLLMRGNGRMPALGSSNTGLQGTEILADIRNNLIWDWGYQGTSVTRGAKANVVNNYYYDPNASEERQKRAIYFCHEGSTKPQCNGPEYPELWARAYIAGNVSGAGWEVTDYLNSLGTESVPFNAAWDTPPITERSACATARQIIANSGAKSAAWGLDSFDAGYVGAITIPLPGCVDPHEELEKLREQIAQLESSLRNLESLLAEREERIKIIEGKLDAIKAIVGE